MKEIHLGTDHAGFALKEEIKKHLLAKGYSVVDHGAAEYVDGDDYPDYISLAAKAVSEDPEARIGIVFGGSGTGEAIVANRYPRVRCAIYNGGPRETVTLSREHNDANVLSYGARFVGVATACDVADEWLSTAFSGDERHVRRIAKIEALVIRNP